MQTLVICRDFVHFRRFVSHSTNFLSSYEQLRASTHPAVITDEERSTVLIAEVFLWLLR